MLCAASTSRRDCRSGSRMVPAAFQEVPHVHWHILPRYSKDGLLVVYPMRVAGRARSQPVEYLKSISGPLIEALKDEVV